MTRNMDYRIRNWSPSGGAGGVDGGAVTPPPFSIGITETPQEEIKLEDIKVDETQNIDTTEPTVEELFGENDVDTTEPTVEEMWGEIDYDDDWKSELLDDDDGNNYLSMVGQQIDEEILKEFEEDHAKPYEEPKLANMEIGSTDDKKIKIQELENVINQLKQNNIDEADNTKKGFFKKVSDKLTELFQFESKKEQTTFLIFLLPPIVISLISAWHVQALFALVNPWFLSWLLAFAFELAALASLFSLKMLSKVNGKLIWALILIIVFMQALGNTFAAYIVLDPANPVIAKLLQLMSFDMLFGSNIIAAMKTTAAILGGSLPIISFLFMKSITQYLDKTDSSAITNQLQDLVNKQSNTD